MRKALLVALAVAIVPVGIAVANSGGLKVTGGGQVIASADTAGPGDTIAFNAQQDDDFTNGSAPAKGQLQVIDRTDGRGPDQVRFHGNVTCIRDFTHDDEDYVRFGGVEKVRGSNGTTGFTVDVQDNGEGMAAENDMILFRERDGSDDPCDDSDPDTQLRTPTLARGNVKEH